MTVRLSDEARRLMALFEEVTDAAVRDCVVDDEHDRVIFLVAAGQMGQAIGSNGTHVQRVEERIGTEIKLVENAHRAEDFVANALAPAAVYNVTISENNDRLAYVEVAPEDRGAAIGTGGRNIEAARQLARRHFDIDGIELT
ncbi:MAG: NusA-like transcription termination signal-binding factor [Haloarculaceae archaeon]